jgi:hypothetical protein
MIFISENFVAVFLFIFKFHGSYVFLICSYLCSIPICDIDLFIIKFAKTRNNCLLTIELLSYLFSYPNNVMEVFD